MSWKALWLCLCVRFSSAHHAVPALKSRKWSSRFQTHPLCTQRSINSPHTHPNTLRSFVYGSWLSVFLHTTRVCLFLPYFTTFHVLSSFLSLVSPEFLFLYFSGCLFSLFNGENCLCHAPPSISNIACIGALPQMLALRNTYFLILRFLSSIQEFLCVYVKLEETSGIRLWHGIIDLFTILATKIAR